MLSEKIDIMKKLLALCLSLLLLASAAGAAEDEFRFETSDWAHEDVVKALDLGITHSPYIFGGDTRESITRGDFAENAASLVAIEFGSHLENYLLIMNYRDLATSDEYHYQTPVDVAKRLGIIQGRGDGNEDLSAYITRQEAATMLARTYRAYQHRVPEELKPVSFSDQNDIAEWALHDVQLMNHMGIMTGVGNGRFDPLGDYTVEQCLISLLRLHENVPYDGSKQENPFVIPVLENGFAKNDINKFLFLFAIETEDYYICARTSEASIAGQVCYIDIIDHNLFRRTYQTEIVVSYNSLGGISSGFPKDAYVSEDGTKLIYTVTLDHDVFYPEEKCGPEIREDNKEHALVQLKGIYTVTMDLKTGEQTYTRADLEA